MKIAIVPIAFICMLAGCKKDTIGDTSTKRFSFSVYKSSNYNFPHLDNSQVETQLSIIKTSKLTGETILVWDTTYTKRPFAEYPGIGTAFMKEKTISGIKDNEFEVKASYLLKYTFEGSTIPSKQFTDTVRYERAAVKASLDVNVFRIDL